MNGIENVLEHMRSVTPIKKKAGEPLDPVIIWRGIFDVARYARERFNVNDITELSDDQYNKAIAEYCASLVVHAKNYGDFSKSTLK